jgi:hypothetical protein
MAMTKMEARRLALAINQEYPGVQAVALELARDHWGVRVNQQPFGRTPATIVFERARAAHRVYPTPYGGTLAMDEGQRRMVS